MAELYGTEIQVLAKALDLRSQRHNLIASNLANADTPGYHAVKIEFEKVLKEMAQVNGSGPIRTTHDQHFPAGGGGGGMEPELVTIMETDRRDGNSVDTDQEVVNMTANHILYNANAEVLTRILALLEYSVTEGGR